MGSTTHAKKKRNTVGSHDTPVSPPSYNPALVLQSFNTWAYKRCQPTEAELLAETVAAAVAELKPVQFVLYWGKGPRSDVEAPELICLRYIAQMTDKIRACYAPGAHITLIATDTHARHNGHSEANIDQYFGQVLAAAAGHEFAFVRLSNLIAKHRNSILSGIEDPDVDLLEKLEACAAKWYRGENTSAAGAAEYYRMNMLEKRVVELAYPAAIFLTFNSAEYRELFPRNMPVFYMYSMRKGHAVKPWFVPVDAADDRPEGLGLVNPVYQARDLGAL